MAQHDDAASQHSTEASLKERRPSLTDSDVDDTVCRAVPNTTHGKANARKARAN